MRRIPSGVRQKYPRSFPPSASVCLCTKPGMQHTPMPDAAHFSSARTRLHRDRMAGNRPGASGSIVPAAQIKSPK